MLQQCIKTLDKQMQIKIPICPTVDYLAGLRDHFVVELSRQAGLGGIESARDAENFTESVICRLFFINSQVLPTP